MNTNMERAMDYYREAGNTMVEGTSKVIDCACGAFSGWLKCKVNEGIAIVHAVEYTLEATTYVVNGTAIVVKEAGKYGLNKTKEVIEKTAKYKAGV